MAKYKTWSCDSFPFRMEIMDAGHSYEWSIYYANRGVALKGGNVPSFKQAKLALIDEMHKLSAAIARGVLTVNERLHETGAEK